MTRKSMKAGCCGWHLRMCGRYPSRERVCFSVDGRLMLVDDSGGYVTYSRRDARLMARRINQALDAWAKAKE